jgi:hypothetical protein
MRERSIKLSVENTSPQPQVFVMPNNQPGGGFGSRVIGAIVASLFISGIGYFATYTTLFARLWLKNEGATVEMPAEAKAKAGVVARSRSVLDDTIGKIKEQLAKTKETAAGGIESAKGGIEKAKDKGALVGKRIEHKVDEKAGELKVMLAHREEEAKKKREEEAKFLATEKAKYDEAVKLYLAKYDATCPNPRCHLPLSTKGLAKTKYVGCAKCQMRFMVGRARALGPPRPPSFQQLRRSMFGGLFK